MSETVVNKPVAKSKMSVGELTSIGLMTAILIVMSFTPLGYFRTLGLSISLMMIPVAIGAMIIGPKAGLWLGLVFGATSFYQVLRIVQHQPPVHLLGMCTYPCTHGLAHRCFVPADP